MTGCINSVYWVFAGFWLILTVESDVKSGPWATVIVSWKVFFSRIFSPRGSWKFSESYCDVASGWGISDLEISDFRLFFWNLNFFVPHWAHLPESACLLFFVIIVSRSFVGVRALHFTQYRSIILFILYINGNHWLFRDKKERTGQAQFSAAKFYPYDHNRTIRIGQNTVVAELDNEVDEVG